MEYLISEEQGTNTHLPHSQDNSQHTNNQVPHTLAQPPRYSLKKFSFKQNIDLQQHFDTRYPGLSPLFHTTFNINSIHLHSDESAVPIIQPMIMQSQKLAISSKMTQSQKLVDIRDEQDRHIDAFSKFNIKVFLEILFYHLLQNYLLGPFTMLVMQMLIPKTSIFRNMMMYTRFDKITLIQNFMWASNVSLLVIYILSDDTDNLTSEILFSQIYLMLRFIIIASRYGNFSVAKMKLYRTVDLTHNQLTRDFYLGEWTQQTQKIIYNDISSTIQRHEIDKQLFYFRFLVDPDVKTADRLVKHNQKIGQFHKKITDYEPKSLVFSEEVIHFYGYSIVAEFIDVFNRRTKNTTVRIRYFATFFCMINILIPIMQRFREGKLAWNLNSAILIPEAYLIFLNGQIVVIYNLIGILDLVRKIFLLSQCANLISAQMKLEISDVKTLPTINIFCWSNLKAWNILRRICFEYGYNYFLRAQILFTVQVVIIFGVAIVFILYSVNVIHLDGTFIQLFSLSFSLSFVVSLLMLYCGAQINGYINTYTTLLCENKLVISQIFRLKDLFNRHGIEPRSFLQSRGLSLIQLFAKETNIDIDKAFLDLKDGYTEALESLNIQAQIPFTIMGIEINDAVFSSYVITLGTIFITIVGQLIFNVFKSTL